MKLLKTIAHRLGIGKKNAVRGFSAASGGRLAYDWVAESSTADGQLRYALSTLRNKSRDLANNNDYAKKFFSMCVQNVVGADGFILQNKAKDSNGAFDKAANQMIEEAFSEWCGNAFCTVNGKLSFRGLQALLIKSIARDGEILVREVRGKINKFGYALQVIEPEHLDERINVTLKNGNIIRMGVELDEWRKPVAYHIIKSNPDTELINAMRTGEIMRMDANEIMHLYDIERSGQTRGIPWMVTAMNRLKMLGAFEEAAVINARIGASKMGFFKKNGDLGYQGEATDDNGNIITNVEPGQFEELPTGVDFVPFTPQFPVEGQQDFIKSQLRGIASGCGVSYNTLANDLEGVNYSSIRAGLIDERETWKVMQAMFTESFLNRVFANWLEMALTTGYLNLPLAKFEKFNRPYWIGRRWQWVDPLKDVNANIEAVKAGFKSRTQVIAEQGGDIYDLMEQLKFENDLAEQSGLKFE